jgi:hypothetical protein
MESGKGFGITKLHPLAFVVNQILIRGLEQLGEGGALLVGQGGVLFQKLGDAFGRRRAAKFCDFKIEQFPGHFVPGSDRLSSCVTSRTACQALRTNATSNPFILTT